MERKVVQIKTSSICVSNVLRAKAIIDFRKNGLSEISMMKYSLSSDNKVIATEKSQEEKEKTFDQDLKNFSSQNPRASLSELNEYLKNYCNLYSRETLPLPKDMTEPSLKKTMMMDSNPTLTQEVVGLRTSKNQPTAVFRFLAKLFDPTTPIKKQEREWQNTTRDFFVEAALSSVLIEDKNNSGAFELAKNMGEFLANPEQDQDPATLTSLQERAEKILKDDQESRQKRANRLYDEKAWLQPPAIAFLQAINKTDIQNILSSSSDEIPQLQSQPESQATIITLSPTRTIVQAESADKTPQSAEEKQRILSTKKTAIEHCPDQSLAEALFENQFRQLTEADKKLRANQDEITQLTRKLQKNYDLRDPNDKAEADRIFNEAVNSQFQPLEPEYNTPTQEELFTYHKLGQMTAQFKKEVLPTLHRRDNQLSGAPSVEPARIDKVVRDKTRKEKENPQDSAEKTFDTAIKNFLDQNRNITKEQLQAFFERYQTRIA
ncbi:MAG: hypothetical protein FJ390_03065 [Verrucomicrobia bacterium]|nr:hypothetical protein [Verrucomicrobiota bacterium]